MDRTHSKRSYPVPRYKGYCEEPVYGNENVPVDKKKRIGQILMNLNNWQKASMKLERRDRQKFFWSAVDSKDLSLPGEPTPGSRHPISLIGTGLSRCSTGLGFAVAEDPK